MKDNNGREIKVLIVAALIISIVAIGIGFAAFTQTLNINGNAAVQTSSWKVKFSDLNAVEKTGTANEVTAPTLSDTTIETYDVTFKTPGDSVKYKFKVANTGSYDAKLTTVTIPTPTCTGTGATATTDAAKVCDKLTYTLTYADGSTLAENDALSAGQTEDLVLTLTYNSFEDASLLPTADVTISNLGITLVYSQA